MEKSETEKYDYDFYKEITKKLGIALHIKEVIEDKYFKTKWGNNKYVSLLNKSIEERNLNIRKCHEEFCTENNFAYIKNGLQLSSEKNESFSALYKYQVQNGKHHWILTLGKPYTRKENNELEQILCASFNLLIDDSHLTQYETLLREITQLKNKLTISTLTKKEKEILQLLSDGKSEKEIAKNQARSLHTIKTHTKNIRNKLGLRKNTELVRFTLNNGIK